MIRRYSLIATVMMLVIMAYAFCLSSYLNAANFTESTINSKLNAHSEKLELLLGHIIAKHYNLLRDIAVDISTHGKSKAEKILSSYSDRYLDEGYISHFVWKGGDDTFVIKFLQAAPDLSSEIIATINTYDTPDAKIFPYVNGDPPLIPMSLAIYDASNKKKMGFVVVFLNANRVLEELLSLSKSEDFHFMIFIGPDALPLLMSPAYDVISVCNIGGCENNYNFYKYSFFSSEGYFRSVKIFHNYNIFINLLLNHKTARHIFISSIATSFYRSSILLLAALLTFWLFRAVVIADIRRVHKFLDDLFIGNPCNYKNILSMFNILEGKASCVSATMHDIRTGLERLRTEVEGERIIKDSVLRVGNDALTNYSELKAKHDKLSLELGVLGDKCDFYRNENAALDKLNKYKSEFLASISHEIRTPLNAITGYAEILGKYKNLSPQKQFDYIGNINDSARYIMGLVNQILGYAKAEYGVVILNETEVNLHKLIEQCITMTNHVNLGIQIKTSFTEKISLVRLDAVRMQQVINNVLGNAIKFSKPGHYVEIQTNMTGSCIEITIIDTGIGIPDAYLSKIFDVFAQANNEKSDHGVGIGLALSKRFVELHGGNLKICSYEKQGTSVTIALPIYRLRRFSDVTI